MAFDIDAKLTGLETALKEFVNKHLGKNRELDARLLHVEQAIVGKAGGGCGGFGGEHSIGSLVTSSDGYQALLKGGRSTGRIEIKSFSEKANIISGSWSSAPFYLPQVAVPPSRRLTIRNLMPSIVVTQNLVEWPNEDSFTNASGYQIAEGDAKPQSDATFSLKQSAIATVATWIAVSRQVVDDSVALEGYLNSRLLYKLNLFIEQELPFSAGGTGKLLGLMPQATAATGSATNLIDATGQALGQLADQGVEASAIVCSASDWWSSRMSKAVSSGVYLAGDPLSAQSPVLWGIPVVATPSMTQGSFLVGDFAGSAAVFDRQAASIELSREHSDFSTKNLVAVLCEERLALSVFRPGAFLKGSLGAGS